MADLIELDLVVREKGLKTSLTTVERLERQLTKAAKAIDNNRISQDRYNKVLLQAKRDYQALGMSSQKATATVRKFAEAQRGATQTTNGLTGALKQQSAAQMAATKNSNRMGVVTQQAGYQVSDFVVQVQSGTNAFVAFGQQASQLVGVLPLMAGSLGLTAKAAIGLSASLGIIIPIMTAIGAALMRSREDANAAAGGINNYADAAKDATSKIAGLRQETELLNSGMRDVTESFLARGVAEAQSELDAANASLERTRGNAIRGARLRVAAAEEELEKRRALLETYSSEKDADDRRVGSNKLINTFLDAQQRIRAENGARMEENLRLERAGYAAAAEGAQTLKNEIAANQAEMVEVFKTTQKLKEQLGEGAYEALRLAGVDMTSGIDAAAKSAATLAANLGVSLAQAQAIQNMGTGRGRGGDPREMGGRIIDWNTREAIAYEDALKDINKTTKQLTKGMSDAEREAERLRKELEQPMVSAIDSVSNAFGDFIARGLSDFKGFVDQILGSFQSMIAKMIATAARNKIMLSLGMGGTGLAGQAAAGQLAGVGGAGFGGPVGSLIGTFGGAGAAGTGLLGGAASSLGGFATGGLSGGFGAIGSAMGGIAGGGLAGIGAAIGAVAAPLLAVAAVFSFFKKKTKELDSGLRITAETLDATVESFKVIQTKRFFGLSKKVRTDVELLDEEAAGPIVEGIVSIQKDIMKAAELFGVAGSAFDNFMYDMEISLKGLTEDQKVQKITEELNKMGDSFASLTGHFETMNELLEAANQRMQLQNRLDQLLGNNAAILARQREAELSAMHELNRPLAQAIYQLEDAQVAVQGAFASLGASIEAEKNRLRDAFTSIVDGLKERLDVANDAMARSNSIYQMLESAVSGRSVTSGIGQTFARREGALNFIRGGDFSDEKKLEEALDVVAEPSEDLFGSFVEYARDFARTSITLEEAKKVAEVQLTADEQQVLLLEQQIADAQANLEAQLNALDQQYQMMVDQYNALLGIDTSVKGVTEAVASLGSAINSLAKAQAAAAQAATAQAAAAVAAQNAASGGSSSTISGMTNVGREATLSRTEGGGAIVEFAGGGSHAIKSSGGYDVLKAHYGFAQGGYHTGGLRMVGERGPELEATGPSRIFSHNQTKGMFKDPELVAEVRNLRSEVSGLRSEQRQMQASNVKYVKRNYDINRKWDTDGLPATRT